MSIWDEIARFKLPVVVLHQHSGQPQGCLEGLVDWAAVIARNKHTYAFQTPRQILRWLWMQDVVFDEGEGPTVPGCYPAQRSRVWPDNGLNCWEAVAHLLAVGFVHQWQLEYHIYDAKVGRQRHVFPAIRPLYHNNEMPVPLVIQPPARTGRSSISNRAAQAWYNDLLGGVHIVGDKVLRVFSMGDTADQLAGLEGDALPDWARTAKQREQKGAEQIKQALARSNQKPPDTREKKQDISATISAKLENTDTEALKKKVEELLAENKALKDKDKSGKGA